MQRPSVSNGKPDGDPLLDELLNQHLLHELITNEAEHPPEPLKRKQQLRSFGLTGLLIFCSAAAIQIVPTATLNWLLTMSLDLFALNIPLLCLALMFEYTQATYDWYDYVHQRPRSYYVIFIVESLCLLLAIFGTAALFAYAHPACGLGFLLSSLAAIMLFGPLLNSLSTNRRTT